ncbi:hypothetical protein AC578_2230 [Pseudocercospora eumusae]|uniref:Uncharacterized protein n=1 Tax=Pseudocercospora eumusae TaxID=321146 RepID=A0A139HAU9_9PEZI|nr:hypothetical protein AC578_2230 [Pseudocercospora eumusae]
MVRRSDEILRSRLQSYTSILSFFDFDCKLLCSIVRHSNEMLRPPSAKLVVSKCDVTSTVSYFDLVFLRLGLQAAVARWYIAFDAATRHRDRVCIISQQLHYTTSQPYHIGVCCVEAIAHSTWVAECAMSNKLQRWDLAPFPGGVPTPSTRCLGKPL